MRKKRKIGVYAKDNMAIPGKKPREQAGATTNVQNNGSRLWIAKRSEFFQYASPGCFGLYLEKVGKIAHVKID